MEPRRLHQPVGPVLIHAQSRGQNAATHHRKPRQLAQALDRTILPVFAMENGKNAVQRHPLHLPLPKDQEPPVPGAG